MLTQINNMLHFNTALTDLGASLDRGECSLAEASLVYEELKAQATDLHAKNELPDIYYYDIFVKYSTFKELINGGL